MNKNLKNFFLVLLLGIPFVWGMNVVQKNLEEYFTAQLSQPFQEMTFVSIPATTPKPALELEANAAILIKVSAGGKEKVLYQKNVEESLPIASLTKLMSAVIVLENPDDYQFSKVVKVSARAAAQDDVPKYSNLKKGESFSVGTLLNLMLIYSSNDAAFALSEVIGTEKFVEQMNQKAVSLSLDNTRFFNPTGLDNTDHSSNYSSAGDLVKISQYILKEHPLIFDISLKKGLYPVENGITTFNLLENQIIIGGKTGYTKQAGGCMTLVFKDENEDIFIGVILGTQSIESRHTEMQKLIDWLNI